MIKKEINFFVIGTPIGNLSDISKRMIDTLNHIDYIYAEDTRSALKLLNHLGIKKPISAAHKDNEKSIVFDILKRIKNGEKIGLMSEAGMPTISDPGNIIINTLIDNNIYFEIISSPTALIHALIASGFSGSSFYFHGFLPHKKTDKLPIIRSLKNILTTIIIYESPHRLTETLNLLMSENFPLPIAICRELTKIYEETIFINDVSDIDKITIKGEFVIVINNNIKEDKSIKINIDDEYTPIITELYSSGFKSRDILTILRIFGIKRNQVYDLINKLKSEEIDS